MVSPGQRRRKIGNPFKASTTRAASKTLRFFGATKEFFLLPIRGRKGEKVVIARLPFNKNHKGKKESIKAVRQ